MGKSIRLLARRAALAAAGALLLTTGGCLPGAIPLPNPGDLNPAAPQANYAAREMAVISQLVQIKNSEQMYNATKMKFGTVEDLVANGQLNSNPNGLTSYNFTSTLTNGGNGYTVTATPRSYGTDGQRSFYLDETGVVRGGNHNGAPATSSDPPVPDLGG